MGLVLDVDPCVAHNDTPTGRDLPSLSQEGPTTPPTLVATMAVKQRLADPEFEMLPLRATIPAKEHGPEITVGCWCERRLLRVPKTVVLAGRTGSCGRRYCRAPQ